MILAFYLQNKGSYQVVKGTKKKSGGGGGGITAPKTLAPALAEMCIPGWEAGDEAQLSRGDVIKAVWIYIRENNLKSDDGVKVKQDKRGLMQKVFNHKLKSTGQTFLKNTDIMGGISPHLS